MVRPVTLHEKPIFVPYVCIQCGLGEGRRDWFVDLGFAIDHYFDTNNQAIYLCSECFNNLTLEVSRLVLIFRKEHEKWEGEEPTYNWMDNNDVRESESGKPVFGSEGNPEEPTGVDPSSDGNDQDSEPDDSEPELTDSGYADTVDDSDTDESDRKTFTAFFGEDELR